MNYVRWLTDIAYSWASKIRSDDADKEIIERNLRNSMPGAVSSSSKALAAVTQLSAAQVNMVHKVWKQLLLSKGAMTIGLQIMQRLGFRRPEIRRLIENCDYNENLYKNRDMFIKAHAKAVAYTIDEVIKYMEKPAEVVEFIKKIGRLHSNLKTITVTPEMIDQFGEAFLDCTLSFGDKIKRTEESRVAWIRLINFITATLKEGFYEDKMAGKRPGGCRNGQAGTPTTDTTAESTEPDFPGPGPSVAKKTASVPLPHGNESPKVVETVAVRDIKLPHVRPTLTRSATAVS